MEPLLQFFAYEHLPPELRDVSLPFCDLAHHLVDTLPRNPERITALLVVSPPTAMFAG
jgi:hypothetical protein